MFIALDFETTGLDPDFCKIVEIGAVKFGQDGQILDTFETLINPGEKIPKTAQEIHGINNEMVKGKPTPREAWEMLLEWAAGVSIFIAHNAQFEASFIKGLYKESDVVPDISFVDTLKAARKRLKERSSYKLVDLVSSFEGSVHRALPDAKACVELFNMISETYKSGKLPVKTYSKMLSEYKTYEEPSNRQLSYISSLGGDTNKVKTKQEASSYIDALKGKSEVVNTPNKKKSPVLIWGIIIVGVYVAYSILKA